MQLVGGCRDGDLAQALYLRQINATPMYLKLMSADMGHRHPVD